MRWVSTDEALPHGEVLLWSGGRYRIGILIPSGTGDPNPAFMDSNSDELLAWPSHWCELPTPPD